MILAVEHHDAAQPGDVPDTVVDTDAGLRWSVGDEAPPGALLAQEVTLEGATDWLLRHDRVDFEPGGIAHRHTHPGPGIRVLLFGTITIDSLGEVTTHGPGEAWFERGPDPVLATTDPERPTAFVRVLLLPAEWAGKRTIHYVDPADADKPKTQRATVFSERRLAG